MFRPIPTASAMLLALEFTRLLSITHLTRLSDPEALTRWLPLPRGARWVGTRRRSARGRRR